VRQLGFFAQVPQHGAVWKTEKTSVLSLEYGRTVWGIGYSIRAEQCTCAVCSSDWICSWEAPHLYTSMVSKPLGSTRLHCSNALADAWYSTISACALPFKQSAYAVFLCLWCNRASDSTHSRPRNIERCASAS
jgi:hypothetical protein